MRPGYRTPALRPSLALAAVGLALLTLGAVGWRQAPVTIPAICASASTMTDAEMASASAAHYLASPPHWNATTAEPAATFFVTNYQFDADHNPATQVDEVNIVAGESVMFKWVSGYHTATSGNPGDLDAGSIWDFSIDPYTPQAIIAFPTPGTYPFHCLFHGTYFGMTGRIVVSPSATPTARSTWGRIKARYR